MPHRIVAYENEYIDCCENKSCKGCVSCNGEDSCCQKVCSEHHFNKIKELYDNGDIEGIKIVREKGKDRIKCSNYTAYFQIDDAEFIIFPKIDKDDEDNGQKIFWNLVNATDKFKDIKVLSDSSTTLGKYELFRQLIISRFCSMMDELFKKGIKKFYSPEEDNLPYLKGKLKFSEHIKRNIASKEKFYCEYDEFTDDIPENRILKLACTHIFSKANEENKKRLRKYIQEFCDIEGSKNIIKDFAKIQPNRMYQHYDEPLDYAEVFLNDKYFWPRRGKKKFPAILFSLHDLFENYIDKLIIKNEHDGGNFYRSKQFKGDGLKNYLFPDPDNQMFLTKMDFVLRDKYRYSESKKYLILDAKYKIINLDDNMKDAQKEDNIDNENKNKYDQRYNQTHVTQADLYQVFTYSEIIKNNYKYEEKDTLKTPHVEIALLYPKTENFTIRKDYKFFNGTKITFIPIDLTSENYENECFKTFLQEFFN